MRKIIVMLASVLAAAVYLVFWQPAPSVVPALAHPVSVAPVPSAESYVKVVYPTGHGSAGYIGNGYFVTAAHVVEDSAEAPLLLSDGRTLTGKVLWANKAYDVALVRADVKDIAVAPLFCGVPAVGAAVTAKGNPGNMDFVATRGHIAGSAREVGPWASAVVVDMTIIPGMSGGPIYDEDGRQVGVTVGVMLAPSRASLSMVGVGYAVPGKVVCDLMGRG